MASSTNVGSIHYDLKLNTSDFDRKSKAMGAKMQNIGKGMQDVGRKMSTFVTLPIVAGFALSVKAASDLNETMNKVDVAFGKSAKTVHKWAETSIDSMGLAKQSALDAAALFGDMSTSMGLPTEQAAKMSMSLVQLGGDLASFKNISFQEAQTALAGVFTGETESLKRLGIVMTEANLEQFALSQGMEKNIKDMTQAEKVQLRYAYVMSKTKNAQGDFARTSSGTANQIRMTQERFKELSAELGAHLLPIANKVLAKIQEWIDKFRNLTPEQQKMILMIAGIVAVLGPAILIIGTLVTAIGAIAGAIAALTLPVTLIVLAIGAVIAVLVYLQIRFGLLTKVIEFVQRNFQTVKKVIIVLIAVALFPITQMVLRVIAVFKAVKFVLETVVPAIKRVGLGIKNWFGNLDDNIKKWLGDMGSLLVESGKDLIRGLINGVKSMAGAAKDAVGNVAGGIKDRFKSFLGINSPSLVFAEYGKNITQGLVNGMSEGKKSIVNTMDSLSSAVIKPTITPQTAIAGQQSSSTSIYGNINIGKEQDADYFFRRINRQQDLTSMGLAEIGGTQ